ncbi:MFS transporter [Brucella pseudogrignonensis]|uniref:MFS transporter n=1 Tax=Brucella pseudogrignonensis TaxID=419475 RepID=UPI003D96C2BB
MSAQTASPNTNAYEKQVAAKRVLTAGAVGQFVEFYDFAIYGFTVVTIAKLFFPNTDPVVGILEAFAIYGLAFVARPLGGVCFGMLGDRLGRKAVLYITLLGIGGATAVIGLLPTYHQIGVLAPILLLVCRLIQGFSAGGEAVAAPAFVYEHAPPHKRGFWVCITIACSAVPSIIAGILILGLSHSMSLESYESWGWRIPFMIALLLSVVGVYIRRQTEESEAFLRASEEAERTGGPKISHSFQNGNLKRMIQVFLIVSVNALTFYFMVGYFVTYMQTVVKLTQQQALISNAIGLLTFSIALPIGGMISDKIGRKPMLLAGSLVIAVLAIPLFWLLNLGFGGAILAQVILATCLGIYGGGSYTFFVELFPTKVRLTGAAIAYNISYAVFGGAGPFVGTYLVHLTGNPASPGIYLAGVAAIAFLFAFTVPETRNLKEVVH